MYSDHVAQLFMLETIEDIKHGTGNIIRPALVNKNWQYIALVEAEALCLQSLRWSELNFHMRWSATKAVLDVAKKRT